MVTTPTSFFVVADSFYYNPFNDINREMPRGRYKRFRVFGKSFCYAALLTLMDFEVVCSLVKYVLAEVWAWRFWKEVSPFVANVVIPGGLSLISGVVNGVVRLCIYNMENRENGGDGDGRIHIDL